MDLEILNSFRVLSERVNAISQAVAALTVEMRSRSVQTGGKPPSPVERKLREVVPYALDSYAGAALVGLLARHESRQNEDGQQCLEPFNLVNSPRNRGALVTLAMQIAIECVEQRQSLVTNCFGKVYAANVKDDDLPPELRAAAKALHDALDLEWEGE